jgi:hypothetical protein
VFIVSLYELVFIQVVVCKGVTPSEDGSSKLKFYGINGKDHALCESYLNNRYIRTVIHNNDNNNIASDWLRVRHGVPQGSILGPLLFLLYINDLPKIITKFSTPIIFADDTSILFSHSNINGYNKHIHITYKI